MTLEPSAWASEKEDHFHSDGSVDERGYTSRDSRSFYKTNLWASGPIVKDKLFFFAMYENRDSSPKDFDGTAAYLTDSNDDFWGAKFDWRINDDHLLELLAFSDKAESPTDIYLYNYAAGRLGRLKGDSITSSGGDNWSLTYTGHFTRQLRRQGNVWREQAQCRQQQHAGCRIAASSLVPAAIQAHSAQKPPRKVATRPISATAHATTSARPRAWISSGRSAITCCASAWTRE